MIDREKLGPICFEEQYFERIWGGRRLQSVFGKPLPPDKPIGEAWLISDHPSAESVVSEGPFAGATLHALLELDADAFLGSRAGLTVRGRFPLLLKLLDSTDWLSVQVHPDDACATRLGEPDVGKTEMWHVLHADPGSQLICGLDADLRPDEFIEAARQDRLDALLPRFEVAPGDSVFVPAGTVHAIGAGILLAEIQQNSDLTYRIYDWNRVDSSGQPRALHLEKSREATHFGSRHGGLAIPREFPDAPPGGQRHLLAACEYFAAELLQIGPPWHRHVRSSSFHIMLSIHGKSRVTAGAGSVELPAGKACLIPGCLPEFAVEGNGRLLDYYVPDLVADIEVPLRAAGHPEESILRLLDEQPKT